MIFESDFRYSIPPGSRKKYRYILTGVTDSETMSMYHLDHLKARSSIVERVYTAYIISFHSNIIYLFIIA